MDEIQYLTFKWTQTHNLLNQHQLFSNRLSIMVAAKVTKVILSSLLFYSFFYHFCCFYFSIFSMFSAFFFSSLFLSFNWIQIPLKFEWSLSYELWFQSYGLSEFVWIFNKEESHQNQISVQSFCWNAKWSEWNHVLILFHVWFIANKINCQKLKLRTSSPLAFRQC